MLDRIFRLAENKTTVRTELLAGLTTFLTMAYIIVVQPMVLSGDMFKSSLGEGFSTGMDFGAVTTATCLSAVLATVVMGLYARYPIAQAPGMGENFFFVLTLLPVANKMIDEQVRAGQIAAGSTSAWQIGLGVVFLSGVLFLVLSLLGVREKLMEAISASMRNGIAIGIGLFIAFLGLHNTGLVLSDPGTGLKMNPQFASPDLIVFFLGLLVTGALYARRVRGAIVWGILLSTIVAIVLWSGLPRLLKGNPFLRKDLSHKVSGCGLHLAVETWWLDKPGSDPVQIAITPLVPPETNRTLTVELLLRYQEADTGYDARVAQDFAIPAGSGLIRAELSVPSLAEAKWYAISVLEDGTRRPEMSQRWTPVPDLPKLVSDSMLMRQFSMAPRVVSLPPDMSPTLLKMDLMGALSWPMVPFIFIFLFMVLFDTLGTLIGVGEQAGFIKDNRLPRAKQALVSDALGTVAGAALGTSTVTSFIESAAGVEQGGRTGLTALTVAALFLLALFFSPLIAMLGSYPPITAPALVVIGAMMCQNVMKIDWSNYAESIPAFLIIAGIPMTCSIADGLALGFIAYPIIKLIAGQGRDVKWLMYVMAAVLVAYFVFVRAQVA